MVNPMRRMKRNRISISRLSSRSGRTGVVGYRRNCFSRQLFRTGRTGDGGGGGGAQRRRFRLLRGASARLTRRACPRPRSCGIGEGVLPFGLPACSGRTQKSPPEALVRTNMGWSSFIVFSDTTFKKMASGQPLNRFVFGTTAQMSALSGVQTMNDLFDRVRKDANRYTTEQPLTTTNALYKRHVLHYLNHRCRGAHLDLQKLERERVMRVSGVYPNQVLTLVEKRVVAPDRAVPSWSSRYNNGLSEEEALRVAVKASVDDMTNRCPLSKMPLRDPVFTIHGRVYERAAIEEWFKHHRTDPLTGERLLTTALFE